MALGLLLPLRIVQAVFCSVVLILSSFVAHWYTFETLTFSPSQVNFLVFAPVFSFLSIAYLEGAPRYFPRASHPYAHLAVEVANSIFYFAGFIALSVFMSKLLFCRGTVCNAARADAAFAAFSFFTWMSSTTLLAISLFKGGMRRRVARPQEKFQTMEDTVGPKGGVEA